MRKLLCIIAAAAVSAAPMSVFAQTFSDINENSAIYESAEDLSALGILSGYDDGTVKPDSTITRAEFAELAAKALPPIIKGDIDGAYASFGLGKLEDVNADFWARHSIDRMSSLGYMTGYDDGSFRSYSDVTYAEAIKVLVSMLNYGEQAERNGGYPDGYIMQASAIGLTDGISFDNNTAAKRGDIIRMIHKLMDIPHPVLVEYNMQTGGVYEQSDSTYRIMREHNTYPKLGEQLDTF